MAFGWWTEYPRLHSRSDVTDPPCAGGIDAALLMASRSKTGDVANQAEPWTQLIVERHIVQIDVILYLVVEYGSLCLVVGAYVVSVRAVRAESDR
jgi:hypothetical protein